MITILVFWVVAIPILSMVGDYTLDQQQMLEDKGAAITKTGFIGTFGSWFYVFDVLFFTLPSSMAPPLWISLFLWLITILSGYVILYVILDVVHGGS